MKTTCSNCGKSFDAPKGDSSGVCPECRSSSQEPTEILTPAGAAGASGDTDETLAMSKPPSSSRPGQPSTEETIDMASTPATRPDLERDTQGALRQLGPYQIVRLLGKGGMGTVYEATDTRLDRRVALKVVRAGEVATTDDIRRFRLEAQSAAKLKHPNIVPIFDVGQSGELDYFVMEYVEGETLDAWLRRSERSYRERVEMIEKVARAIHHAHEQGIVHRDIKPGNVMVDAQGEPHVMDFGLARNVKADSSLTVSGTAMGTPAYMPPEQAQGKVSEIEARSDVWSLGAVLYEALTGRPPFTGENVLMILQSVTYDDPILPRVFNGSVPADIETICMKCLEKERSRRYSSAARLADDCRRFLEGEPISARPASVVYRVRKKLARHRAVTAVTAAASVALVGLAVWSYVGIVGERNEARHERDRAVAAEKKEAAQRKAAEAARAAEASQREAAEAARAAEAKEREKAEFELYISRVQLAQKCWEEARTTRMRELLEDCPKRFRDWEWGMLHRLLHLELVEMKVHTSAVISVAFSPDGGRLASASPDGTIRIWEAEMGRQLMTRQAQTGWAPCVAFSPTGGLLASGGLEGAVQLWDADSGELLRTLHGPSGQTTAVAFAPDGTTLASGGNDGIVHLWDARAGNELARFQAHSGPGITKRVRSLAFSPEGETLASVAWENHLRLWDVATSSKRHDVEWRAGGLSSVCYSPDGGRIAACGRFGRTRVWDTETWQVADELTGHTGGLNAVAFSPDGKKIASAGDDTTVAVWDAESGKRLLRLRGHRAGVHSLVYSPEGTRLASACADGTIRVWDATRDRETVVIDSGECARDIDISPDGAKVVGCGGLLARVWDAGTGARLVEMKAHTDRVLRVVFSPDGRTVASSSLDRTIRIWGADTGRELRVLRGHGQQKLGKWIEALAFSPDSKLLASGSRDNTVRIWNLREPAEVRVWPGHGRFLPDVQSSPDGSALASCGEDRTVLLRDLRTEQTLLVLPTDTVWGSVAFSPDGTRLAYVHDGAVAVVWALATNQKVHELAGHMGIYSVRYSPFGTRIVTADSNAGTVRLWDARTGREVIALKGRTPRFSANGMKLILRSGDVRTRPDDAILVYEADPWWEPGNPPKRPKPVRVTPRPVPEARPAGAGKDDEQF